MQNSEFGKSVREYLLDYIKFADAKAVALLTIMAALGSIVGFAADRFFQWAAESHGFVAVAAALLMSALLLSATVAAYYCLTALNPSVAAEHGALCSFPDIAKMAHDEYVNAMTAAGSDRLTRDLASHAHTLSTIASAKFSAVRAATTWLGVFLAAVAVLTIIYAGDRFLRKDDQKNGKQTKQSAPILRNRSSEPSAPRAGRR